MGVIMRSIGSELMLKGGVQVEIKRIRDEKGVTRTHLAQQIGVAVETLARWERGEREPLASDVARISEALGCNITDLIPNPPLPPRRKRKETLGAKTETVL